MKAKVFGPTFCWLCSRQLYGFRGVAVALADGHTRHVHRACVDEALEDDRKVTAQPQDRRGT